MGILRTLNKDLTFDLIGFLRPVLIVEQEDRQPGQDRKCRATRCALERNLAIAVRTVNQVRQAEGQQALASNAGPYRSLSGVEVITFASLPSRGPPGSLAHYMKGHSLGRRPH